MTPTSDERREVAAWLHEFADTDVWLSAMFAVLEKFGDTDRRSADVIADLIDPTCTVKLKHVVVDDYRRNTLVLPVCSACGFTFDKRMPKPNFCPECGARVVSDDE